MQAFGAALSTALRAKQSKFEMSFTILPNIGDRVVVHGKHAGTVRFVGSVDYANGDDWCGIEMDESGVGKNNGTVKG